MANISESYVELKTPNILALTAAKDQLMKKEPHEFGFSECDVNIDTKKLMLVIVGFGRWYTDFSYLTELSKTSTTT